MGGLKGMERAVAMLKEALVSRFGEGCRDVVEAEVAGRMLGRSRLEREDIDAIERSVMAARKGRRGGDASTRLARSAPDLRIALEAAVPPSWPPASTSVPSPSAMKRPSSRGALTKASLTKLRPPPFGLTIVDEDNSSERSRVKVNPKHFVPMRPKQKPMDHWDLMVAYDAAQHRAEDTAYRQAGKYDAQAHFKNTLDGQMEERFQISQANRAKKDKERQDMLAQMEENRRLKELEEAAHRDKRDRMQKANDDMTASLHMRKQRQQEKKDRERMQILNWVEQEKVRKLEEKRKQEEEFARKCADGKREMDEAYREKLARKKAAQDSDKEVAVKAQQDFEHREAEKRAFFQAKLDKIERNCATLGAEIAERDAKAEQALQEQVRKALEESDRKAAAEAEFRKSERIRKVRQLRERLDGQVKEREQEAAVEKLANMKQGRIFLQQAEESERIEQAKREKARKAREDMDQVLIGQIRRVVSVHPTEMLSVVENSKQDLAYNRNLLEKIAKDGFRSDLTGKLLSQANCAGSGKGDPYPSVGRYELPIHPLELQVPE